ncbi:hypothetical protein [uncultured Spongiibacter sp.]|uniref:hypothetical protein n=1 Tax=uncultured Spongiibacter sp. TaxID=870896 RepID=UPI0025953991|nr:hypothetical protein [uncultured Spongiibacter sp.]
MSIRKKIRNDYYNHYDSIKKLIPAILNPSFQAVLLLRIAENASVITFWFWRTVLILKHSIDVGRGFSIGDNIRLPHPVGIVIGGGVVIGSNVTLYQNVTLGMKSGGYPIIGDGSVIYPSSVVVGGITLGAKVIIGALSFVDHDVDSGVVFKRK